VFAAVTKARDAGYEQVRSAYEAKRKIAGWEVDKATRQTLVDAGFGEYFTHRTGHSIATEVHGNGANMDGLETKDDREIIPNTLFSIEPGVYLPEFGVRSEFDVLIRNGRAEITGKVQKELVRI
jgi:Xaa-Pro dipeptidase